MILRSWGLLVFVKDTGVENGSDSLIYQPLYMAVGQLGGVALGLGGDGLHA